ncbi:universal stress protein UspA [Sinomonas cyclohexanicum]|uniref:Universal stress protein UspA n=1 Tax=Sinomonas cyclohexanicum TaxID=322009 RepID=A0ABM7PYA7_SINCY|nr:universal stress protein [Corynebacterium cyclohexanicum]BCT77282.1 universal stress protein UspA [Corynebacterium cyclohexanicum]
MRYVVGYQPDQRGADAVALGVAIARAQGASLDLMLVLSEDAPYIAANPDGPRVHSAEQQTLTAQREALALVPEDVEATFHVRHGRSFAATLIEAAVEFEAALIVVGAASNGLFKRYTVGSVANALLHASPVPVALAPRGYHRTDPIERITAFIGEREGSEAAVDVALVAAGRRNVPLRFVSLVEIDERADEFGENINAAHRHANTVLTAAAKRLPEGHEAGVEVAHGRTFEEAVDSLDWLDGELALVGSSRLAQKNQLFLGSTANKVLRALPVPMVVIPRDYEQVESHPLG